MGIPLDSIDSGRRSHAVSVGLSAVCQSCGRRGLDPFYEVLNVPVHSVTLLPTRGQALEYPTADVLLGFCRSCGFIQNLAYRPEVQDYSKDYEETQAFSPHFNEFASWLADRLVEAHDVREKDVLEIGGGKGDFLALLCEKGNNRGVGIDPAYVPGRLASPALDRITFIRDFYGPRYVHLTGDLICCRHTLEHIAPVREFTELMHRSAVLTEGSVLFIEVPDVMRVLSERAFWDIYYEHCSYFTRGSLARLLAGSGFEVAGLELAFDDQYLLCEATVDAEGRGVEIDDLGVLEKSVAGFAETCGAAIDQWRTELSTRHAEGQRIVLWGAGSKAVAFLNTLGIREQVPYAVDINPYKHGTYLAGTGQECVPPAFLRELQPDLVIAMNPAYSDEIRRDLHALGLSPELTAA